MRKAYIILYLVFVVNVILGICLPDFMNKHGVFEKVLLLFGLELLFIFTIFASIMIFDMIKDIIEEIGNV